MKLVNKSFIRLISLSVVLIYPIAGYSQIQGSVRDRDNKPVSYANVLLLNQKDSTDTYIY